MPEDRRQRKTKAAIKKALAALIQNKPVSRITVNDVADYADINRSTFYLHYCDVYSVLDEIERDTVDKITGIIEEYDLDRIMRDPFPLLRAVSDSLGEDELIYGFLKAPSNNNFYKKVELKLRENLLRLYVTRHPDEDVNVADYCITFITSGVFGAYQKWYYAEKQPPLEDLSKLISRLITCGISRNEQGAGE